MYIAVGNKNIKKYPQLYVTTIIMVHKVICSKNQLIKYLKIIIKKQ